MYWTHHEGNICHICIYKVHHNGPKLSLASIILSCGTRILIWMRQESYQHINCHVSHKGLTLSTSTCRKVCSCSTTSMTYAQTITNGQKGLISINYLKFNRGRWIGENGWTMEKQHSWVHSKVRIHWQNATKFPWKTKTKRICQKFSKLSRKKTQSAEKLPRIHWRCYTMIVCISKI